MNRIEGELKPSKLLFFITLSLFQNLATACDEVYLKKNIDRGRMLLMSDGKLYKTLAGDSFNAMLWLTISSILVCGPQSFEYKGSKFYIYELINKDDGEKASATLMK